MAKKVEERKIPVDPGFMGAHGAVEAPVEVDDKVDDKVDEGGGEGGEGGEGNTPDPNLGPNGKPPLTPAGDQMAKDNF